MIYFLSVEGEVGCQMVLIRVMEESICRGRARPIRMWRTNEGWRREDDAGDLHYRHRMSATLETLSSFVAPFDRSRQTIFAGIFHRYRSLYLANRRNAEGNWQSDHNHVHPQP